MRSRGAGTFVDVGGDSVSTDRASLTDIAGPDEGNTRGYLVDGHAVGRGNHNRAIAPDNTPGSATVHTIGDRGFKLLRWSKAATIGVRPSEPCPSGPTAHVSKRSSHAPTRFSITMGRQHHRPEDHTECRGDHCRQIPAPRQGYHSRHLIRSWYLAHGHSQRGVTAVSSQIGEAASTTADSTHARRSAREEFGSCVDAEPAAATITDARQTPSETAPRTD